MMRFGSLSGRSNDGFALFVVLGFMLLLALILTPFSTSSRLQFLTSIYRYNQAHFTTTAQAINDYLAWRLSSESKFRQQAEEGSFTDFGCWIGRVSLQFRIIPHAQLVNLNGADVGLLDTAFQAAGLQSVESRQAAEQVVKYRTRLGDEAEGGEAVHGGYKRAHFEDISELHDFALLQHLPLSSLGVVFSTYSGKSIASAAASPASISQHVTIETVFRQAEKSGGERAVFVLGSSQSPVARMAATPAGNDRPDSPLTASCEAILPVAVQLLVREVL